MQTRYTYKDGFSLFHYFIPTQGYFTKHSASNTVLHTLLMFDRDYRMDYNSDAAHLLIWLPFILFVLFHIPSLHHISLGI